MERGYVKRRIGDFNVWDLDGVTIDNAIEVINNFRDYANEGEELFFDVNWDGDTHTLELIARRLETDEEYQKRTMNETAQNEVNKARRRQEYLRLKKEFEGE